MTEIVMYSTDYSDGILRKIPYVGYFDERGLHHLAGLRDPRDRMALVTLHPVDPAVLDYHFRDVLGMDAAQERSARDRLTLLCPAPGTAGSLVDRVLADPALMARLRAFLAEESQVEAGLAVFAAATGLEELGAALGVSPSEGPYERTLRWGSKSGSRTAFRGSGVAMPRGGVEVLRNVDDVLRAATALARLDPPPERVVVKLDSPSWANGIGNAVLDSRTLLETRDLERSVEVLLQSWEDFVKEILRDGAIVEEFLGDVVCSPSGQGVVDDGGRARVTSTHEQIVASGQYLGCRFPAGEEFRGRISDAVLRVGDFLGSNGMRGAFGVDFVGLADGRLLAVEVNARKVAPSHVVSHVESATGARVGDDGTLTAGRERLCYAHRRLSAPELARLSAGEVITALRDHGLLYDHATRRGVLLHILGALRPCGYVEATWVDTDPDRAAERLAEAENVLWSLAKAAL